MAKKNTKPVANFSILGPVTATLNGDPVSLGGPLQVAVLARLILSPRRVVSLDELSESIWEDDIPAQPQIAIRSYISNLRKILEPHRKTRHEPSFFVNIAPGYQLDVQDDAIDWVQFENLLVKGRSSFRIGKYQQAARDLRRALELWQSEPCAGIPDTDNLMAFRNRLGEQHLAANELLLDARIHLGEAKAVVAELEALIAANPLRERLTELCMLALYQSGRQSDALSLGNELRTRLREALGIDPGKPIQDLEVKILNQDKSIQPATHQISEILVPPSLAAVPDSGQPKQTELKLDLTQTGSGFVGRAKELQILNAALSKITNSQGSFVAICGEHGIGKTALIDRFKSSITPSSAVVASGRCLTNDSTWLWVWTQALGEIVETFEPKTLKTFVSKHPAILGVLPKLAGSKQQSEQTLHAKAHTFAAVTELLKLASKAKPLVVVTEDLHSGDRDSVDLLNFAAKSCASEQILFVASWRSTELFHASAAGEIKDLASVETLQRLELEPFTQTEVKEILDNQDQKTKVSGKAVHKFTGGVASFVVEAATALAAMERPSLNSVELSTNCLDLLTRRIELVDKQNAPEIFSFVCLSEDLLDHKVLADASELDTKLVTKVLMSSLKAGLISADGSSIGIKYPIMAHVLKNAQPELEQTYRKQALADAFSNRLSKMAQN